MHTNAHQQTLTLTKIGRKPLKIDEKSRKVIVPFRDFLFLPKRSFLATDLPLAGLNYGNNKGGKCEQEDNGFASMKIGIVPFVSVTIVDESRIRLIPDDNTTRPV